MTIPHPDPLPVPSSRGEGEDTSQKSLSCFVVYLADCIEDHHGWQKASGILGDLSRDESPGALRTHFPPHQPGGYGGGLSLRKCIRATGQRGRSDCSRSASGCPRNRSLLPLEPLSYPPEPRTQNP